MDGIVLGNRYELLEKIGEGGMSEVFKARCNKLNRFVAVKILKKEFCNNPDIVEKFKGEATAIATLSDNNIVNILDVGTQDDINYIVMEYVKGKTLKDIIKQVGKMNYETAISVALQIARALDCAHRNKIIHRDVKPQNILVTEDGVMKVTDFGIAKSPTTETITNTSTIMGSAHYLSPEQAKGSFIDCRTDLYSLGVVLYEMVTGTLPFQADTAVTIALKHLQEEVVPPKNINSKIPESLNQLILKSMQKEPIKRYQSAKEMIADLQKIKDDPNVQIDKEDNDHTIIMSAVTQQIPNSEDKISKKDDEYDDDDDYYYDDEEEKEGGINKNKIIKVAIGVSLVLLLLVLGVGAYKIFGSASTSKEVQLPNLVGMKEDDAKNALNKLNLVLVEGGKETSDQPEGTVIKMNPDSGTMVKEKSEVRVIVSNGGKKTLMPDLVDYDIDRAKTILDSLGLKIDDSSISYEYSDTVPKGQIISQVPKKDTEVTSNDKITVVVSNGSKYTTVPNVVGLSADDAKSALSNAGLNVNVVQQDTENESENGKVLKQSDSKAKAGATITITVGNYVQKQAPPTVANPETTNKTGADNKTPSTGAQSPANTPTQNTPTAPGNANTPTAPGNTPPAPGNTNTPTGNQGTTTQNKATSQNK
ncbi:Stk1 family PASTA domain-containing Ser/Thr kinase [Clostridium sp.]|uniref:Stk1 family PASTA domain-containing Ser/Thr kinase n=1 Tax=Clostridium sp. TaxID=1506 RepID=UPI00284A2F2E|nr:Stk1 family PASTA domain-containing Ser/Thr kinase [Clostridium sp.]MDR3598222.1 Stk1 family PASTA domain-containing Ser/Thr kinase [Clostridium sp.]